jgi:hypothetical protein
MPAFSLMGPAGLSFSQAYGTTLLARGVVAAWLEAWRDAPAARHQAVASVRLFPTRSSNCSHHGPIKPFTTWTVVAHDQLIDLDDNVMSVTGRMQMPPMGEVERRMTVVRLGGGRLVIWSAIALGEAGMRDFESFGRPAYLVAPGDLHRLDARPWKDRYPELVVVAPAAARAKVEEVVPVNATEVDFGDARVRYMTVPGTGEREAALLVEGARGTTLVINDLIFDLASRMGSTDGCSRQSG